MITSPDNYLSMLVNRIWQLIAQRFCFMDWAMVPVVSLATPLAAAPIVDLTVV